MKYFFARMSFYKNRQKSIEKKVTDEDPIDLLERLLREHPEYTPDKTRKYDEKRGHGLLFGNFIPDKGKLVAVNVGRSKELPWEDYDREKRKFLEVSRTKFPFALILWDRDEQTIIIEKKSSLFPNIQALLNSLENHFNFLLKPYEIIVSLIPITTEIDFWSTISQHERIYSVNFSLKMPNMFGHTNEALKETLEQYKKENNAEELSTKISNLNGSLKLKKDSWITPVLKWIIIGGGYWSVRCAKKDGTKETIKNTDNAKTIEISKELVGDSVEEASLMIQSLKTEYQIKDLIEEKYLFSLDKKKDNVKTIETPKKLEDYGEVVKAIKKLNGYLFSWDDIPGQDNGKLIDFLKIRFSIDWIETAKIEKIDDGMTIRVYFENNFLSLKLNDEKTKVHLYINNDRVHEFDAEIENGKLNIY